MNNLQQFLKEYYQLCKKYNMELIAYKFELNIQDLTPTKGNQIIANDVNVYFGIEEIDYCDTDYKLVTFSVKDND